MIAVCCTPVKAYCEAARIDYLQKSVCPDNNLKAAERPEYFLNGVKINDKIRNSNREKLKKG